MKYGKRKWSATGTEMPSNISRIMERIGGSGGGSKGAFFKKRGSAKSSKAKAKQQGMKTDSQYQSQQKQLEGIKARVGGGSTVGRTGIVKKSSSLKNQKVKKRKGEKDTMEQNAAKQAALRKKAEKQEAQNKLEQLYGGWVTPKGYHSKANIKKRKAEGYKPGKIRKKKKKNEEEKSTPFHHEGGSGK